MNVDIRLNPLKMSCDVRTTEERRVLVFDWGSPQLSKLYSEFLDFIRAELPCRMLVVTAQARGALLWAERNFEVVTLADVYRHTKTCLIETSGEERIPVFEEEFLDAASYIGDPDIGHDHSKVVREYRKLYEWLIVEFEPDCVMTWNGNLTCQAALTEVGSRRGLATFFVERGLFPSTFWVDPKGVNFASSLAGDNWSVDQGQPVSRDDARQIGLFLESFRQNRKSVVRFGDSADPREMRARLGIPPGARIVLFPLQIESDTNIRLYSPLFSRMADAVVALEESIKASDDVYLVVKPHPENLARGSIAASSLGKQTRMTTEYDLHSLIEMCDVVVTINSTVGFEACCLGKRTITLGDSVYSSKGFTTDVRSIDELQAAIVSKIKANEGEDDRKSNLEQFLAEILKNRLFPLSDDDAWQARSRIVEIFDEEIQSKTKRGRPIGMMADLLSRKKVIRDWIMYERGYLGGTVRKCVLVGAPPLFLEEDVFGTPLRNTVVVCTVGGLISVAIESWYRPIDLAITLGRPSLKRKIALFLLRTRASVCVR